MTQTPREAFNPKDPIPELATREEIAEFWDTHDITDYLHELKPVKLTVAEGLLSVLQVEFDKETTAELFRLADHRGLLATAMVQAWVLERLRAEKGRAAK